MFRIQENLDGTTSIFCRNSGSLLCTIPSKGSNVLRPVNVVEPQPAPDWNRVEEPPRGNQSKEPSAPLQDEKEQSDAAISKSQCCLLVSPAGEASEDYYNEGVSQDNFSKCLELISVKRLQEEPRDALRAEWPLRLLSRSKAFRSAEDTLLNKDVKVPDQLPLTSHLGVRVLRLNEARHFVSEERMAVLLRSYESFCRHPYNTACPTSCHFPKLRCRVEKAYPMATPSRILRHLHGAHHYCRGRRQRTERMRTLKAGLDARSRRLLRLCNAKTCTVDIERLKQVEIDDWLSRRTVYTVDSDTDVEDPVYKPSSRVEAAAPLSRRITRRSAKVCKVRLTNVLSDIQLRDGSYFVRDTKIHVPFHLDYMKGLKKDSEPDCANKKLSEDPEKQPIPVIDLTDETSPVKETPPCLPHYSAAEDKAVMKQVSLHRVPNSSNKLVGHRVVVGGTRDPNCSVSNQLNGAPQNSNKIVGRRVVRNRKPPSGKLVGSHVTIQPRDPLPNRAIRSAGCPASIVGQENSSRLSNSCSDTSMRQVGSRRQVLVGHQARTGQGNVAQTTNDSNRVVNRQGAEGSRLNRNPVADGSRRFVVSKYKFHCFACGQQRLYRDQEQRQTVERAVRHHLVSYHSVQDTEAYLSRYLDSVNHITVIEAFPGFKAD